MHEADIPMAQAMQAQYNLFGIRATPQPFPIEPLNSQLSTFNSQLSILHTPGHTPGSVCFYWQDEKVLLSGDTLFRMGYGRTDLPGGDMGQMIDSLRCLFTLPDDTRVYPGHGDFTTIGAEKRS
jgi:glyoxylase-like metal-dependent hydrolase (beta-lactamase superfamily II)